MESWLRAALRSACTASSTCWTHWLSAFKKSMGVPFAIMAVTMPAYFVNHCETASSFGLPNHACNCATTSNFTLTSFLHHRQPVLQVLFEVGKGGVGGPDCPQNRVGAIADPRRGPRRELRGKRGQSRQEQRMNPL